MIGWLLVLALSRPYWPVTIAAMPHSTRTHVEVEGHVLTVANEADGDVHFRIGDRQGRFVVCEIIPTLTPVGHPFARPKVGQLIRVRGIRRVDSAHQWSEVHPVEFWEVIR